MIRYYKLLDILNRRDLKKTNLINDLGLSPSTVAKITKGDNINTDIINRICTWLNVQPGDIMEYIPDED